MVKWVREANEVQSFIAVGYNFRYSSSFASSIVVYLFIEFLPFSFISEESETNEEGEINRRMDGMATARNHLHSTINWINCGANAAAIVSINWNEAMRQQASN